MSQHKDYNVQLETTLDLYPDSNLDMECPILIEATAEVFTDTEYGADADGNRGEIRAEIRNVHLETIRIYFSNRPTIIAATNRLEVAAFLSDKEYEVFLAMVCDEIFEGRGEEV